MVKRILTALVLIPLALALVLWAPPWLFFLGLLPFAFLALWEYLELMARAGTVVPRLPVYLVALATWWAAAYRPAQLLPIVIVGGFLLFTAALLRSRTVAEIPSAGAAGVLGLLYVAVPFALMLIVRGGQRGAFILLYLLILVWVGDTTAYFVGRALGRRKLAPQLSPGKTVEGTVGSLLVTVAVGFWLYQFWFAADAPISLHGWLLPLVVNLASQLGDLAESGLKRAAGAKDSSALLPGHGGMLDRVDALLFAIPALWYYWNGLILGGF